MIYQDGNGENKIQNQFVPESPIETAETQPKANPVCSSIPVSYTHLDVYKRQGKVPGGRVTKVEYDMEDGRIVYEVDILLGGVEHEFEIDALTGDILKWEQEREDDDDHNRPDSSDKPTTPTCLLYTSTEANLMAAFAGESQARNKYTYYASKAKRCV